MRRPLFQTSPAWWCFPSNPPATPLPPPRDPMLNQSHSKILRRKSLFFPRSCHTIQDEVSPSNIRYVCKIISKHSCCLIHFRISFSLATNCFFLKKYPWVWSFIPLTSCFLVLHPVIEAPQRSSPLRPTHPLCYPLLWLLRTSNIFWRFIFCVAHHTWPPPNIHDPSGVHNTEGRITNGGGISGKIIRNVFKMCGNIIRKTFLHVFKDNTPPGGWFWNLRILWIMHFNEPCHGTASLCVEYSATLNFPNKPAIRSSSIKSFYGFCWKRRKTNMVFF